MVRPSSKTLKVRNSLPHLCREGYPKSPRGTFLSSRRPCTRRSVPAHSDTWTDGQNSPLCEQWSNAGWPLSRGLLTTRPRAGTGSFWNIDFLRDHAVGRQASNDRIPPFATFRLRRQVLDLDNSTRGQRGGFRSRTATPTASLNTASNRRHIRTTSTVFGLLRMEA